MLSDLEKGPKTVGIVSSDANLAPHVGHKIDITGTAVPPADAEAMKGVDEGPSLHEGDGHQDGFTDLPIRV